MAAPEKTFAQKLLGIFVKEAPTATTPQPAAPAGPAGPQPQPGSPAAAMPAPEGRPEVKFMEHFAGVLEKANLQGADYFEFRQTLQNLSAMNLPEEQRYQAAWASFKALSGQQQPALLTQTAQQYLTALNADREAFLKSVETALQQKVGGLKQEQQQLQAENQTLEKQLTDLKQRLTANADRLSKPDGEMAEQSQKLTQSRANYEATFTTFTSEIKADLERLKAYLGS